MAAPAPPGWLAAARPLLAFTYLCLSHAATTRQRPALAALAVGVIVVMLLAQPLWQRRAWAWGVMGIAAIALVGLARSPHIQVALLLMPVVFLLLIAWLFGRTLRHGQVPVIGRIVSGLEGRPYAELEPDIIHYTRRLTALWVGIFLLLAASNLTLATLAVPSGLLARLGIASPWPVSDAQWSWFANWVNYGLCGAVFVGEYLYRKRRFPGRYKNAADFGRRLAALGPAFWRDLFK